ncbi:MAG: hypothetical protein QOF95_948 [Pseudonocardiales bacterium]|nr:hypothetical protein [Pseudonocardiales bacterium]
MMRRATKTLTAYEGDPDRRQRTSDHAASVPPSTTLTVPVR